MRRPPSRHPLIILNFTLIFQALETYLVSCYHAFMTTGIRLKGMLAPYAKSLQAVANEHRFAIIYLLAHNDMMTREFVDALRIPENLVSHHLKILRESGWVKRVRQGKRITYSLNKKPFKEFRLLFWDTPFFREHFSPPPK